MLVQGRLAGAGSRRALRAWARVDRLLLAGILLAALAWRFLGLGFGLPYAHHPDEPWIVRPALNMLKTGDLNPHWFEYGSLFIYFVAAMLSAYYLVGRLLGIVSDPGQLSLFDVDFPGQLAFPSQFLVGRMFTVALGLLTILVLYHVGERYLERRAPPPGLLQRFPSGVVGLIAASLLSFQALHVESSHFIATDVPGTLFITLAIWWCFRVWQTGRWHEYALAGLWVGLAASTKAPLGMVAVTVVAAAALHSGRWPNRLGGLCLAGVCSMGAYLLGTPFALLDWPAYWRDMEFNFRFYSTGLPGFEGESWLWYLRWLFLGPNGPMSVVGLGALVWGLWRRDERAILLGVFPLAYYALLASHVVRFERYLLPMAPFLALLAADALAAIAERVARPDEGGPDRHLASLILALGTVLLVVWPAWDALQRDLLLLKPDVRDEARAWFFATVADGSKVAVEKFTPDLPDARYQVLRLPRLILHDADWYRREGVRYLVFSQVTYGGFLKDASRYPVQAARYRELFASCATLREWTGHFAGNPGWSIRLCEVAPG